MRVKTVSLYDPLELNIYIGVCVVNEVFIALETFFTYSFLRRSECYL